MRLHASLRRMTLSVLLVLVVCACTSWCLSCADGQCYFASTTYCDENHVPSSIHSQAENAAARQEVSLLPGILGGYAIRVSGEFQMFWMDESSFDFSPTGFSPTAEGYIAIGSDGSWSIVSFGSALPYICQIASSLTTTTTTAAPMSTTTAAPSTTTTTTTAAPTTTTTTQPTTIAPDTTSAAPVATNASQPTSTTAQPATSTQSPAAVPVNVTTTTLVPNVTSGSPVATTVPPNETTTIPSNDTTTSVPTLVPNMTTVGPVPTAAPNATTVAPNGTTVAPNGTTVAPNATTVAPNGTTVAPNGTTVAPNGTTVAPNGTTVAPNATTVAPNGTTVAPNGTTVAPNGTTVAPNGTTVAPNVTTVAPNATTVAPNVTTLAPPSTPPPISAMIDQMAGWLPDIAITVTAFTANAVDVFVASDASAALAMFELLQQELLMTVVVGCDASNQETVSSLSFDPVTRTAFFAVPPAVLTTPLASDKSVPWTKGYDLCIGAVGSDGVPIVSRTSTRLIVQSLLYSLVEGNNTVRIVEEDVIRGVDVLQRLQLYFPSESFQSRRVSAKASQHLSLALSLAPPGSKVGDLCTGPLVNVSESFVVGMEWGFVLSATELQQLWAGKTGYVCATIEGTPTSTVVGVFLFESFAARVPSAITALTSNSVVLSVTLSGLNPVSLMNGDADPVTGFVSSNASCTDAHASFAVTVVSQVVPNAAVESQVATSSTVMVAVASSDAFNVPIAPVVCIAAFGQRLKAVVNTTSKGPLIVVSSTAVSAALPQQRLVIVEGSRGPINLADFVIPAQSAADMAAATNALNAMRSGIRIFFATANVSASMSEKHDVCLRATPAATSILQVGVGGVVVVNTTVAIPSEGIVCSSMISQSYMRIDVVVVASPAGMLSSALNGASFLVPPALSSSPQGAMRLPDALSEQLSLRLASASVLGSCSGVSGIPIRRSSEGFTYALLSSSDASIDPQEVCVGTWSSGGSAMFVGTGVVLRVTRFDSAFSAWKEKVGATSTHTWTVSSGAALCGYAVVPFALPVENGVFASPSDSWPIVYESQLTRVGNGASLEIKVNGVVGNVPAVFLEGRMYAFGSKLNAVCLPMAPLRLSSDHNSFGITSIATMRHPVLFLLRSSLYTGLVVSLVDVDASCSESGASGHELVFSELWHSGTSAIDLAPVLWSAKFQFFSVCALIGDRWVGPFPDTFVLTSFSGGDTASSWANAIGTRNPLDTGNEITLWQTQSVSWDVYGRFATTAVGSNVSVVLVWDDPTCLSSPATAGIQAPVAVTANDRGVVTFDVDAIKGFGSRLYFCYAANGSSAAWPMTLEAIYGRYLVVRALAVSELQYRPSLTLSPAHGDVYLPLTDSRHAPVTGFAVYVATSTDDKGATSGCSLNGAELTALLPIVALDRFGIRWVKITHEFLDAAAPTDVTSSAYFVFCATASTGQSPKYQPVNIALSLTRDSSVLSNLMLNAFIDVRFDIDSAANGTVLFQTALVNGAARQYAARLVASAAAAASIGANTSNILVVAGVNATSSIAILIPPAVTTGGSVVASNAITSAVYQQIGTNAFNTPLTSDDGAAALPIRSVTERLLYNESVTLRATVCPGCLTPSSASDVPSGTRSFLFFCAVVIPVTIGIILYALRQPPPRRMTQGSDSPGKSTELGQLSTTKEASPQQTAANGMLSPSPRRPIDFEEATAKVAQPMPIAVAPQVHDTVHSPLYDDSDGDNDAENNKEKPVDGIEKQSSDISIPGSPAQRIPGKQQPAPARSPSPSPASLSAVESPIAPQPPGSSIPIRPIPRADVAPQAAAPPVVELVARPETPTVVAATPVVEITPKPSDDRDPLLDEDSDDDGNVEYTVADF